MIQTVELNFGARRRLIGLGMGQDKASIPFAPMPHFLEPCFEADAQAA